MFESIDHIEDRYALDLGKIPVTEKLQEGGVCIDVHTAVHYSDRAGLLLEALSRVRIVPYDIVHQGGG